jgi:hypothetical protein
MVFTLVAMYPNLDGCGQGRSSNVKAGFKVGGGMMVGVYLEGIDGERAVDPRVLSSLPTTPIWLAFRCNAWDRFEEHEQ